jgi:hypothetical protein
MAAEQPALFYLTLKISAEGLSEISEGRSVVFLPKADIERIELIRGSGAERPGLQIGLGSLLALLGLCGFIPLLSGNLVLFRYEIGFTFFGLIGVWMIWEALRRRTFLLVLTRSDKRKLFLHGKVETKPLVEFLEAARTSFGFNIQSKP